MKNNPTPTLPLSGEGVKDTAADIATDTAPPLAPPPAKGEVGRGLNKRSNTHSITKPNKRFVARKPPATTTKTQPSKTREKNPDATVING